MSKWKDSTVVIIQAFQGHFANSLYGLGDDQKLYEWSCAYGAWEKYWSETDTPANT